MRVVVAMSGGVDSSVAALLLKENGLEVIGVTMKLWNYDSSGGASPSVRTCCSVDSVNNARRVCGDIGIPHYTLDFQEDFKRYVVDNFIREYLSGKTPNPCIRCNTFIKWNTLLQYAKKLNAEKVATGHYARIYRNPDNDRYELIRGKDSKKDQTYALWGLNQDNLARTLFPLGDFEKQEVREIAARRGLITAETPESQEICFIPDNDYRKFLQRHADAAVRISGKGLFLNVQGEVIGEHSGYHNFTIGQRKGLGMAFGKPMYVKEIVPDRNVVILAEDTDIYSGGLLLKEVNWVSDYPATKPFSAEIQIRYNHKAAPARIIPDKGGTVRVIFKSPQRAVTPGQSGVVYRDNRLVLGGIIEGSI